MHTIDTNMGIGAAAPSLCCLLIAMQSILCNLQLYKLVAEVEKGFCP